MVDLKVGNRIRPAGALHYGTLGFFCSNSKREIFLATCDHVVNMQYYSKPPSRIDMQFEVGNKIKNVIAVYEGKTLTDPKNPIADIALCKVIDSPSNPSLIPQPDPFSLLDNFRDCIDPEPGMEVMVWGASTGTYAPGVIVNIQSDFSWPHSSYGHLKFAYQFAVAMDTDFRPGIGDSGGIVITGEGELVGMISAMSGSVSKAGNVLIYCTPVLKSCNELKVTPIIN